MLNREVLPLQVLPPLTDDVPPNGELPVFQERTLTPRPRSEEIYDPNLEPADHRIFVVNRNIRKMRDQKIITKDSFLQSTANAATTPGEANAATTPDEANAATTPDEANGRVTVASMSADEPRVTAEKATGPAKDEDEEFWGGRRRRTRAVANRRSTTKMGGRRTRKRRPRTSGR